MVQKLSSVDVPQISPELDENIKVELQLILAEYKNLLEVELNKLTSNLANIENSAMDTLNETIALGKTTLAKLTSLQQQLQFLRPSTQSNYLNAITHALQKIDADMQSTHQHLSKCESEKSLYQEHLSSFHNYFKLEDDTEEFAINAVNDLLKSDVALNSHDHPAQIRAMMRMANEHVKGLNTAATDFQAFTRQVELVRQLSEMHQNQQQPIFSI